MRKNNFIYNNIMNHEYIIKTLLEKIAFIRKNCPANKSTKYLFDFINLELIPFLVEQNRLIELSKLYNVDKIDSINLKQENERLFNTNKTLENELNIKEYENNILNERIEKLEYEKNIKQFENAMLIDKIKNFDKINCKNLKENERLTNTIKNLENEKNIKKFENSMLNDRIKNLKDEFLIKKEKKSEQYAYEIKKCLVKIEVNKHILYY